MVRQRRQRRGNVFLDLMVGQVGRVLRGDDGVEYDGGGDVLAELSRGQRRRGHELVEVLLGMEGCVGRRRRGGRRVVDGWRGSGVVDRRSVVRRRGRSRVVRRRGRPIMRSR